MNALQVGQVIIRNVHTDTEVQTSVTSVDNLEVPELQCKGTHDQKKLFFTTYSKPMVFRENVDQRLDLMPTLSHSPF